MMDTQENSIRNKFSRVYTVLVSWATLLYKKFVLPRSMDEDVRRRELILNYLLLGTIFLIGLLDLSLLYGSLRQGEGYQGIPFIIFTVLLLGFIQLYALSRQGKVNTSAYIYVIFLFLSTSYGAYRWSIALPTILLGYVWVIATASIVLGTRAGVVFTSLISATMIGLGYLQINGIIVAQEYWRTEPLHIRDAIYFASVFSLIMLIAFLSNREREKSFARARASEVALKRERDLLEVKVEERTKAIKQLQIRNMMELYRSAEFGKLASGIFHDLVNPLTAVSLNIERLNTSKSADSDTVEASLKKALEATTRMERFLKTVRKEINSKAADPVVSVREEVEQVIQILGFKARNSNVRILSCLEKDFKLQVQAVNFHQVMLNLVSNAIDAYDEFETTERFVRIVCDSEQYDLRVCVRDNGKGIPQEVMPHIFEPFFSTKTERGGMGIGLSTTKEIVEGSWGGKLSVASELNHGTTFEIFIPMAMM